MYLYFKNAISYYNDSYMKYAFLLLKSHLKNNFNVNNDPHSHAMLLEQQQERPEKFRSVRDSNHDLCNAGAIIGILIQDNPSVQSTVINGVLQIGLRSQF